MYHSTGEPGEPSEPDGFDHARAKQAINAMFTGKGVEQAVRQAVVLAWVIQPEGQRTPERVEAVVRAAVDYVLAALKADPTAFGVTNLPDAEWFRSQTGEP